MAIEIGSLYATLGLDSSEYDKGLAAAPKKIDAFAKSVAKSGQEIDRNLKFTLQNLSFQINDIGTSLASGSSPGRVLAQQAGQIIQAFQQGGGVSRVLGAAATSIRGLITPSTLAVAGLATVGVGVGLMIAKALEVEKNLRGAGVALKGFGTESLATAEDGEKAVRQLREIGIAADEARSSVDKIRRTPGISPSLESTTRIATAGADLGAILRTGTEAGTDKILQLLQGTPGDLIRFGVELRKILPLEADHIRQLNDTKGATAASDEAFRLISTRISGSYSASLGDATKKWIELKNAFNDFLTDASTSSVIKFLIDEMRGLVKGLEDTIQEFKRVYDSVIAIKDAAGRGIASITAAGDRATVTATANHADMAAALAGRDDTPARFDRSGIAGNTDAINRLSTVLAEASKALPEGFRVVATSGKREGTGGSLHNTGEAIDVKIFDPSGNPLANKGRIGLDPGLYKDLAIAARDANDRLFPGSPLTWGGRFETSPGSGMADWMHFDVGQDRGRFGSPLASLGQTTTSASAADGTAARAASVAASGSVYAPLDLSDVVIRQVADFAKINEALRQRGEAEIRATALIQGRTEAESKGLKNADAEAFAQNVASQAVEQHRIGLSKAASDQELSNKRAIETAKIYSTDYVAALRAAAAAQAELAVRQGTATDAGAKTAEILRTQAAEAITASAAAIPGMQREVQAAESLAAALKISEAAGVSAEIQAKVAAATHELMAKALASGSKEALAQAEALKTLTEQLIKRSTTAELSKKFSLQNIEDTKTVEQIQLETSLQGSTSNEINRQIALLRVKQEVQASGNMLSQEEVDLRVKSVNAIFDANKELERQKGVMSTIREVGETLQNSFTSIFDTILNHTFKLKAAIGTLVGDLGKLLVNKAFKALFEGESAGGTGSGLFGMIGKLFGVGGGSSSSAIPGFTGGGPASEAIDFGGGADFSALAGGGLGIPAFAGGGSAMVGGSGAIDSKIVSFRATPGELVNVRKGGQGGGGSAEVIRLELSHDSAFVSDIADQRVRTHSGTIIDVAVKRSQQATKTNFNKMASETRARQA